MGKKTYLIVLLGIIAFASIATALETKVINGVEYTITDEVSFIDKIKKLFQENIFTIVGQDNKASTYPDWSKNIPLNYLFEAYANGQYSLSDSGSNQQTFQGCSSGHGLFNIYSLIGSTLYNEWESKDSIGPLQCGAGGGCLVELYCLPYDFCTSNTQCVSRYGSGSQCLTKSAPTSPMPFRTPKGTSTISTYTYCSASQSCSQPDKTCWGYQGGACVSATYTCDYPDYNNLCLGGFPYSSQSQCQSANQPCTDECFALGSKQCSGSGYKTCGNYDSDNCYEWSSVTSCTNGCSNGNCIQAVNPTCSDGVQNQGEAGVDCGGPCAACTIPPGDTTTPTVDDPDLTGIQILSLTYGDSEGKVLTGPVNPGDQIRVNFKVKITEPGFFSGGKSYFLEAGVIPGDVATSWFGKPSGQNYQIFDPFSVYDTSNSVCCQGQENINSVKLNVGLQPSDLLDWLITKDSQDNSIYSGHVLVTVPSSSTQDICPVNNNPTSYWNPSNKDYALYLVAKNGCKYQEGVDTGYSKAKWLIKDITVDINGSLGDGVGGGQKCEVDSECAIGSCVDAPGWFTGKICSSSTTGGTVGGNSLIDVKKIALSKEEISGATSQTLLSSACLSPSECVLKSEDAEDNEARCITIAKLRADGILTEDDSTNFFGNAKTITKGTVFGATAGVVSCSVLWGVAGGVVGGPGGAALSVASLLANPVTVGSCAGLGGLLGGTGTAITLEISQSDNLIKELDAENANAVGICTLESSFNLGSFIEDIGKKIKITGNETADGFLVLIGGIFLLMIILNMLGGKK